MALLDILGSAGAATAEFLPRIQKRQKIEGQKRINSQFRMEMEAAVQMGDFDRANTIMQDPKYGAVTPTVMGAAGKGYNAAKKVDEDKTASNLQQALELATTPGGKGVARTNLWKHMNPDATPEELIAHQNRIKEFVTQGEGLEEHKRKLRGLELSKAQLSLEEKRLAVTGEKPPAQIEAERKAATAAAGKSFAEVTRRMVPLLTRGEISHKAAIDQVALEYEATTGNLLPAEDLEKLTSSWMESYGLKVKLGEESNKRMARATGIQFTAQRIIKKLDDPIVIERIGKLAGNYDAVSSWISGTATRPPEMTAFQQLMGFVGDDMQRMQSGAALTTDEQTFYRDLLGESTSTPENIRIRMEQLISQMDNTKRSILIDPLAQKYGGADLIPEEVMALLPGAGMDEPEPEPGPEEVDSTFDTMTDDDINKTQLELGMKRNEVTGLWEW